MNTITLPDPKDGTPVELEIPDDPRWHQSTDTPGQWRYEAIDIWGHRVSFAPDSYVSAYCEKCVNKAAKLGLI